MTTPPHDASGPPEPDPTRWSPEPVAMDPPVEAAPFDPYRFGAPEHPVPPEYAPPGYQPPPMMSPPSGYPPQSGYAGSPYPYQPPAFNGYPQPQTGNGKAIAALVLGIMSIVFFWTAFFDLLLIIPAIVFGSLATSQSRRQPGSGGAGLAKAGLICTVFGLVFAIAFTVFVLRRIDSCDTLYSSGSQQYNTCLRDGS